MKNILILSIVSVVMFASHIVAADDFGARFSDHTPSGLAEYTTPSTSETTSDIAMDDAAQEAQEIIPAAGDSESEEETPKEEILVEPSEEVDSEEE